MITMKDIVLEGAKVLRQKAAPVTFPLDDELKQTALEMREYLVNSQDDELAEKYKLRPGVGLAAPQINLSKQLIAVYVADYDEEGNPIEPLLDEILINPQIISHSVQQAALKDGEGCLSVERDVPGFVPRARRLKVRYQDLDGQTHEIKLSGFLAIVLQHEIDHLNGIMFYDHIDPIHPLEAKPEWQLI